jgi:hypothetical protein
MAGMCEINLNGVPLANGLSVQKDTNLPEVSCSPWPYLLSIFNSSSVTTYKLLDFLHDGIFD